MAINKKLIHFKTKSAFQTELDNSNLMDSSIVFIKETGEIWTHGKLYNSLTDTYKASELKNLGLEPKSGDTFETAISKLHKAIIDNEKITAAAINKLNESLGFDSNGDTDETISKKISDLQDFKSWVENILDSDNETLDQISEIIQFISDNKLELVDFLLLKVNINDIQDNLNSDDSEKPLSARLGKLLKTSIDNLANNPVIEISDKIIETTNFENEVHSTSPTAIDLFSKIVKCEISEDTLIDINDWVFDTQENTLMVFNTDSEVHTITLNPLTFKLSTLDNSIQIQPNSYCTIGLITIGNEQYVKYIYPPQQPRTKVIDMEVTYEDDITKTYQVICLDNEEE